MSDFFYLKLAIGKENLYKTTFEFTEDQREHIYAVLKKEATGMRVENE